jgi:alkanesulfonate monooxygenase SsuD/methylene tetrahydromethanopterin reductase-like flavin-dependent oxidoreductase (luciferase family)
MQCGIGGDARQSSGMGVDIRLRPSMFEESLATIRALWRGESVTVDGRWRLHKSRIAPLPPEPIEVWIGASAKVAIDRAARLGDAWLADPGMDFDTARRRIDEYREACLRHGRVPSTIAIRRDTYVGASVDEARRTMARYLRSGYRGFSEDALLIGDVDQVAQRIAELGAMGYTDVIIRNISAEQPAALATIERLALVQALVRDEVSGI